MELKIAHISLNVFQSDAKREADIRKVFARGNHIITVTDQSALWCSCTSPVSA